MVNTNIDFSKFGVSVVDYFLEDTIYYEMDKNYKKMTDFYIGPLDI